MTGARFAVFLSVVLSVWTLMHVYVFWRLSSVPWIGGACSRPMLILMAAILWCCYPMARWMSARGWSGMSFALEVVGANWMGVIFLLLTALVAADLVTLGGWCCRVWVPAVRGGAVIIGLMLSALALVQGFRPPVVTDHEVVLKDLPKEMEGRIAVVVSDVHWGGLIRISWLQQLTARIQDLRPDVIFLVGDIVDGEVERMAQAVPTLQRLRAPFGVWAVTGNHEYYAGIESSVRILESAGFTVLRDQWAELAPGLIVAGVDDLTARRQFGLDDHPVEKALANRSTAATILLSHTPWDYQRAADAGVGLMLSGHTHDGQIWPFRYLVKLQHPKVSGRFDINGMTLIVGRGTGTWGPRMRLWQRSEIVRLRLMRDQLAPG